MFVAFFQGERLKSRVKKVCEGFHASLYPCPTKDEERTQTLKQVRTRLEDLKTVLNQTQDHRQRVLVGVSKELQNWSIMVRKMKAIYYTLNLFNVDVTKKCLIGEGWIPISDVENVKNALTSASVSLHPCNAGTTHYFVYSAHAGAAFRLSWTSSTPRRILRLTTGPTSSPEASRFWSILTASQVTERQIRLCTPSSLSPSFSLWCSATAGTDCFWPFSDSTWWYVRRSCWRRRAITKSGISSSGAVTSSCWWGCFLRTLDSCTTIFSLSPWIFSERPGTPRTTRKLEIWKTSFSWIRSGIIPKNRTSLGWIRFGRWLLTRLSSWTLSRWSFL